MRIGIVGHGSDKFSMTGEIKAKGLIRTLLAINEHPRYFISGHSPVGGIDIWAEEIAKELSYILDLKIPKQHTWNAEYGYKQRNLDITKDSDVLHVILVDKYPSNYKGMRFQKCYHCNSIDHIKSGACWTAKQAIKLGKKVVYHIIKNES